MRSQLSTPARGCPPRDDLQAFHRGELPDGELKRVADHLADCESCTLLLADLSEPGLAVRLRQAVAVPLLEEPELR